MGWFDEQIRQRKRLDQAVLEDALGEIAGLVLGGSPGGAARNSGVRAKAAIDEILSFYHAKTRDLPDGITDLNELMEFLLRPHGVMRRSIKLEPGWYKDAAGAILAFRQDNGEPVALIPAGIKGYTFFDSDAGKRRKVDRQNQSLFQREAEAFYKPFPQGKLGMKGLLEYIGGCLCWRDWALFIAAALGVSLVGLLLPRLNNMLFSSVVDSGNMQILVALMSFMVLVTVSSRLLETVKQLIMARMNDKVSVAVSAASMMRVLSLPARFFMDYSTGELASRAMNIEQLSSMLLSSVASVGLTSVFSLVQISQIFAYAPALVAPAMAVVTVTLLLSLYTAFRVAHGKRLEREAKVSGFSYAVISGVQKIKLSGAEKRAFAQWSKRYALASRGRYLPSFFRLVGVVTTAVTLTGTLVMYALAVKSGVSVAEYYAFNSSYAVISGAFASLAGIASVAGQIVPVLKMARPILDAEPEVAADKPVIDRLSGGIELNSVSFRYREDMPNVVDDLSLKIRPGQYVAIVGRTGCGKSTLMRLMLGFETPQKGAIYYDGRDMAGLDLKSLRRRMGVVMQDGKLFQGDIFSNITISAPWLTMDDTWEAAELAGVAEDIRRMPMGMHTLISEGSGGVSGGQRQRILIARAIAAKPRILLFDEATSALDNITQRIVSESLDQLKCTRIVIAHRLSTIRHCDRIIVLDGGHIVEDGGYDELLAKNGVFAELVARQRLDMAEASV